MHLEYSKKPLEPLTLKIKNKFLVNNLAKKSRNK